MEEMIVINGVKYVKKEKPKSEFCIIRTYSAGVFAGYVKEKRGHELDLVDSIRIWKWSGAASLSQLAQEGTNKPESCKFGMIEPFKTINGWIEITPTTEQAEKSIKGVEAWKE